MESMEHLCRCENSCLGHRLCGAAIATFPPVGVCRELKTQRCMPAPVEASLSKMGRFGMFDVFSFSVLDVQYLPETSCFLLCSPHAAT